MINATPEQLRIISAILAVHAPGVEARAFGSRVNGSPKNYSDLDLALVGAAKLDSAVIGNLREAFEESDIPFRVDIIDWHSISKEFQTIILNKYEVLAPPANTI
ncbi:MAG TPA: nucleotidyltransferase domain-containing protein [Elusimicrobia bacterium]|nr:nucleotidyltransferase domain-containing protein [Elusimicrobiota bacterium]